MKLATFQMINLGPRLGVVSSDGASILDAGALAQSATGSVGAFGTMLDLIDAGPDALSQLRAWTSESGLNWINLGEVTLLAPLPNPRRLRCFSTYEKHLVQAFQQVLKHKLSGPVYAIVKGLGLIKAPKKFFKVPAYYKGNHLAISGPDQTIDWPSYSQMLDYELELGLVIGKPGKDVPVSSALDHVFGYTIFNDFSARDALMGEMGFGPSAGPAKGKDFDTSNAIGPWIVTADEMGDPASATMTVRVNGVERGTAKVSDAAHSVAAMVAYASRGETLCPGEMMSCGAVGDGTGIESWRFLVPGDRVELMIERIGTLANILGPKGAFTPL
ncbi:MAG: fumarylacetoacetate hydrolase family protein [Hyphomonadaceae bacterium]|jgi:2-keto-4-pentenoate hydratase/2-oxohepta-3-ene-1,7-dioic acid hydratase in catechol pathway|uniref:fumarylacetoacetate hydrolase family protein n=1 Tax=Aquidulcibacter sp. TaxID=2052990 RepID=UPI0022C2CE6A|nr:fumarylacetoacetate hydrolase family protein [Aquidulcibacter sp.]MCE2889926.1 fumarylacetoacetate hydrolase family protein [Hyphomonadaceae bacterium]MCZ8209169.1 fumarylacetoacetate hydrolase family protein [Aquidulcibacter sp.]